MQSIEPDQVQLEHNASQEPAPHTQEPLQYAPVASSDHDRRFQKVRLVRPVGVTENSNFAVVYCAHRSTSGAGRLYLLLRRSRMCLCAILMLLLQHPRRHLVTKEHECLLTAESASHHCGANIQAHTSFRVCPHSHARYDGWRVRHDKRRWHAKFHSKHCTTVCS